MMRLSEQDEKELGRLSDGIDAIAQKLRAFRDRKGNLDGLRITPEYLVLRAQMKKLQKEFDSIP